MGSFVMFYYYSGREEFTLSAETVNPVSDEKIGPDCFDLLKVLGKGGYGKARYNIISHVVYKVVYGLCLYSIMC